MHLFPNTHRDGRGRLEQDLRACVCTMHICGPSATAHLYVCMIIVPLLSGRRLWKNSIGSEVTGLNQTSFMKQEDVSIDALARPTCSHYYATPAEAGVRQ